MINIGMKAGQEERVEMRGSRTEERAEKIVLSYAVEKQVYDMLGDGLGAFLDAQDMYKLAAVLNKI